MSSPPWRQSLEKALASHDYMAGVERTVDRVKATGEIFTPNTLVVEMIDYLDPGVFAPGKTVLDPACGDGQFLVAAKAVKMHFHGMTETEALAELFGVDIMRDNVDLCLRRLGGGTVIMGNTLDPSEELEGQTIEERRLMRELFGGGGSSSDRVSHVPRPRSASRRPQDAPATLADPETLF
jgi:hypothetical protein